MSVSNEELHSTRPVTVQEAVGQILIHAIFKCQETAQRHSDILEKEAQPSREERKETIKKKGGEGGRRETPTI